MKYYRVITGEKPIPEKKATKTKKAQKARIEYSHKLIDKNDNPIKDKKVLAYIAALVIPPAYRDVTIFYEPAPKILFEGFDDKGRKQQIYSAAHKKKSAKAKYCHLIEFGKALPKIESDMKKYIQSKKLTKNKLIALIIRIVIACGFRIGNLKYQRLYGSFGISNIFKEHVSLDGKNLVIKFVGKKGVLNECVVTDKILVKELLSIISRKSPKEYVFTYENEPIKATEINAWLKSYNKHISSKFFRTWDTNILFIEHMRDKEDPNKITEARRKKNIVEAMKLISCQINNTPAICKKEYLHSDLMNLYISQPRKYKRHFHGCSSAKACLIKYLEQTC
jgi:DNA topoisomerase-1